MPTNGSRRAQGEFDAGALFLALDAQRTARGLSWAGVAREVWEQSAELNSRRNDHPISPATLSGIEKRDNTSCQHALFILRWLGRTPESFAPGWTGPQSVSLPECGPDRRLRWDLKKLGAALDEERRSRGLTWIELAVELRCSPGQISNLHRLRFATGIALAMRVVQWLRRPSSDFIYSARW